MIEVYQITIPARKYVGFSDKLANEMASILRNKGRGALVVYTNKLAA